MESGYQEGVGLVIPFQDEFPYAYSNANDDLGFIDFMDEANFDQFIDLIRGDDEEENPIQQQPILREHSNMSGLIDDVINLVPPPVDELFDFSVVTEVELSQNEDATTKKKSCNNNNIKVDRSKTLISERKRRGRMKEKLYALRSLVPNITKMDKASIVGDAVSYVRDLQMQAKNLTAEIAGLKTSLSQSSSKNNVTRFYSTTRKIFKMDVFQVDKKGFYVRVVGNKGNGVAASIYKAIESVPWIIVESSNLTVSAENYVVAFTLQIVEKKMEAASLENLKVWISRAFINLGFQFEVLIPNTHAS
ncbi:transcription factor FER-LIKE IRON DEFICIENCY-INDUCED TRANSCRIPTION FACTOR-like [Andrographis paniculata]|uniref:transcription factor FER-LIKE IRON DEFICIENCY-INDUCED TRANSCRIPTION FACTOR-like n=1 Tax=Andrographis paniculata TaxID=175694 RepID=UPI0021E8EC51|nr:transcription factor FER-LIKE IRON DEFICIENCY-INDUCED TRANSCRIPTION FACTOR-like [Andrographis paniculata]